MKKGFIVVHCDFDYNNQMSGIDCRILHLCKPFGLCIDCMYRKVLPFADGDEFYRKLSDTSMVGGKFLMLGDENDISIY